MSVKKQPAKTKGAVRGKTATVKKVKASLKQAMPSGRGKAAATDKAPPRVDSVPTANTCPLVLDGEIDADDFSAVSCLSCDEFDCRFCEAAAGSGALRSRLFASPDDEESDDDWDSGTGFREEDDDDADIDEDKIF